MSIKNIVFDWSGTLCNDFELVFACDNEVHQQVGNPPMSREFFARNFELPIDKYLAKMYPDTPRASIDSLYAAACKKYDRLNEKVTEIKNARHIVKDLHSKGYNLYIFSAASRPLLLRQAHALRLDRFFRWITGGVSDKVAQLPEFLRQHGLDPAETMLIGDMVHDMDAGRAAGVLTIGVLTGYGTEEQLSAANPAHIINDLEQLPLLLCNSAETTPAA